MASVKQSVTEKFFAAVSGRDTRQAEQLARNVPLNTAPEIGYSPLLAAAEAAMPGVIRQLIARGVDVDAPTESGVTALMIAARNGDEECFDLLRREGKAAINLTDRTGLSALTHAMFSHRLDMVRRIVQDPGADLNYPESRSQFSPLMMGLIYNTEAAQILLDAGVPVTRHRARNGGTAEDMAAARSERSESAKALSVRINARAEEERAADAALEAKKIRDAVAGLRPPTPRPIRLNLKDQKP